MKITTIKDEIEASVQLFITEVLMPATKEELGNYSHVKPKGFLFYYQDGKIGKPDLIFLNSDILEDLDLKKKMKNTLQNLINDKKPAAVIFSFNCRQYAFDLEKISEIEIAHYENIWDTLSDEQKDELTIAYDAVIFGISTPYNRSIVTQQYERANNSIRWVGPVIKSNECSGRFFFDVTLPMPEGGKAS